MTSSHDTNRAADDAVLAVAPESVRRERALLLQKLQHVLPSVVLLFDGLHRFSSEGERTLGSGALATVEVVSSLLVILAFIRSVRRLRGGGAHSTEHAEHAVDWVDVFLGGTLLVEALVHRQETGHLPRPTLLLAVVLAIIGVFHGRIAAWGRRRRELRVSAHGISIWRKWSGRLDASWAEISSIELHDHEAVVATRAAGTRRINLRDVKNRPEVERVLSEARARLERHQRDTAGEQSAASNG